MTITFKNDSDVIVYAFEKVIAYARRTQQIFVAQCVWWLASIIGLESGLISHIDNLHKRDQAERTLSKRAISSTPRDLTEDSRLDRVLEEAEKVIATSERARNTWQRNRINPLPQTKNQLKKARKVKRLQEANRIREVERNQRLQKIRDNSKRDRRAEALLVR